MPKHDVRLHVSGQLFGGWKSINIRRGMSQVAGTFELGLTERWKGQDTPRPIKRGQSCKVSVDGQVVVTGYVDDANIDYDDKSHSITVTGRDATGDLVDCSAPSKQFSLFTLVEIAEQLCQPFGVGVINATETGKPFQRMKNDEGDTVFETLESAARVRAVLLLSDGKGNLVLSRASNKRISTRLVLGENIKAGQLNSSDKDRYSEYTVKGQTVGTDDWSGEAAAHPEGKATDKSITRHRPLTILSEDQTDQASAQERAEWERNVRFGRSQTVTYTVRSWFHESGLWAPNVLVAVEDAFLGLDCDLLLTEVALILDKDGSRTELTLCPRETYERMALPEPGSGDGGGAWS